MDYYNQYDPYTYAQQQMLYGMQPAMAQPAMQPQPAASADTVFTYPQNLPGALALIQQAVAGETEDRMFYTYLMDEATSAEDKEIISEIRNNEISHHGWFQQIYYEITGRTVPEAPGEQFTPPANYCEGLARAMLGEQAAVAKYRRILYAMQSRVHINMLTEIITDEIRHGLLYNYLYAKNGCRA